MQAGVNVNAKDDDNWTALHKAAFDQAETGIVDLLLESGVDIEAKNKSGKTALQLAEEKGHRDIVRVIKKHKERLVADARKWEEFLVSPEGKPYKQKRIHESLVSYLTAVVAGSSSRGEASGCCSASHSTLLSRQASSAWQPASFRSFRSFVGKEDTELFG